jgi:hypothetical protein
MVNLNGWLRVSHETARQGKPSFPGAWGGGPWQRACDVFFVNAQCQQLKCQLFGYPGVALYSTHSAQVAQQRPSHPSQNYLFFTTLFFIHSNRVHAHKNKTNTMQKH